MPPPFCGIPAAARLRAASVPALTQAHAGCAQWQDDLLPIARNIDSGDLLVVHTKGISTWSGDDGLGSTDSPSLAAYLEAYRNKMLGGHVEYVEDCGIMEVA
jgi:hypothetical protein